MNEAVRLEGATPPLTALLTWSKVVQVRSGMSPDRSLLDEAEREARELLRVAPGTSYGHSLLGYIEYERSRLPEAVHHLKLALEQAPNDSDINMMLGVVYAGAGRTEPAQAAARRMLANDPLSPMSWMATAVPLWFVGRTGDSIAPMLRGLELDPGNLIIQWCVGYAYAVLGRLEDAARHAGAIHQLAPDVAYTRQLLALVDALGGRRETAAARIASLDPSSLDAHHQFHLAESWITAGDQDRGLALLERCVPGFHPVDYLAEYCPFLAPVRGTPRFQAVLREARDRADAFIRLEGAVHE